MSQIYCWTYLFSSCIAPSRTTQLFTALHAFYPLAECKQLWFSWLANFKPSLPKVDSTFTPSLARRHTSHRSFPDIFRNILAAGNVSLLVCTRLLLSRNIVCSDRNSASTMACHGSLPITIFWVPVCSPLGRKANKSTASWLLTEFL